MHQEAKLPEIWGYVLAEEDKAWVKAFLFDKWSQQALLYGLPKFYVLGMEVQTGWAHPDRKTLLSSYTCLDCLLFQILPFV